MEPDKATQPPLESRVIELGQGGTLLFVGFVWAPAAVFTLANLDYFRGPLAANQGYALATVVVDLLCLVVTFFAMRATIARIDMDNTHIAWMNMIGMHRSIALRDLQSDMILVSTGMYGGRFLRLCARSGPELMIPAACGVPLEELRDEVARRCREAAGFEVSTTGPLVTPRMERTYLLVYILLPWALLIAVAGWNVLKHYGLLGP